MLSKSLRTVALLALTLTGCATHHRIATPPAVPIMHGSCPIGSQLCIEADQMPQDATRAMFGPLRDNYGSAAVRVCSKMAAPTTVPLPLIESEMKETNGITVVPSLVALSVIEKAQANTKTAVGLKWFLAAVQVAALSTQLSSVGASLKSILTEVAVGGSSLWSILQVDTASGSIVKYSDVTLPETLLFQPNGCTSGIVLDYSAIGVPPMGSVSFGVVLGDK